MTTGLTEPNRRILIVDDMPEIHEDYSRILRDDDSSSELDTAAAELFGSAAPVTDCAEKFELSFALQGNEAYEMVCRACDAGKPFAMAFVDMRMPPGWDGVQTIRECWTRDPDLEVVICTAYSDYALEEIVEHLGNTHKFLFLRKPFDCSEVKQLANALTRKRETETMLKEHMAQLEELLANRDDALAEAMRRETGAGEMIDKMESEVRASTKNIVGKLGILWMQLQRRLNSEKLESAGRIWDSIEKEIGEIDSAIEGVAQEARKEKKPVL